MSDGVKGAIQQTAADLSEAIVKPVVDEMGKAIEEGVVQPVASTPPVKPPDPAVLQIKQMEEQKKKAWAVRVIDWYKKIEGEQQKVRQAKQQGIMQTQQEEQQKKQVKQFQVMEKQKKEQQLTEVQKAARKTEIKGGVGG